MRKQGFKAGLILSVYYLCLIIATSRIIYAQDSKTSLLGTNYADNLFVDKVSAKIVTNDRSQRGFLLQTNNLVSISKEQLAEGWVSWSFLPEDIGTDNFPAIRQYIFDHYFGFTNDSSNILLDNGVLIPDEPVRVTIFSWKCVTDTCDTPQDIPAIVFISKEKINYSTLVQEKVIDLTSL